MDTPWQKYMQLGIVHFMIYPQLLKGDGPIVETARHIAADHFFEVLEVGLINDPAAIPALKALAEESQLTIGVGAQPGLLTTGGNLANLDEAGRQTAVAKVEASIDQAYALGARLMAFLDGKNSYPGAEKEQQARAQFVKSVRELCAYAKAKATDYTLTLSLEIFDRAIEKRSLLGPTPFVAEVAAEICSTCDNFGLTVDLSHIPQLGETPRQALEPVKDYLVHLHVGNCLLSDTSHPAYGDYHPPFCCAGGCNGVDELVDFMRVAFEIGYFDKTLPTGRPVVTFEVKPLPGGDPEAVIGGTKRVWELAWARL
ncbi:MAG TPA: sugar phosphate isomerase/epimerase family protein [Anaerolineae bacterium]|nr:sugar phosphate isomerase/epimerase family protein [Anaerolineae bacterium]HOR01093.1 sugar phosphate isomerase/epimerase family protein [Anaerolineae bacterium]HPL29015.1 sugar phosphate isomerase/epimerase family protein [Anaerolineae bacterium]